MLNWYGVYILLSQSAEKNVTTGKRPASLTSRPQATGPRLCEQLWGMLLFPFTARSRSQSEAAGCRLPLPSRTAAWNGSLIIAHNLMMILAPQNFLQEAIRLAISVGLIIFFYIYISYMTIIFIPCIRTT